MVTSSCINYKEYIGMDVLIRTIYSQRHPIQGELVAVYSNVLCVQGLTLWGILARDIIEFVIVQPKLSEVKPV